MVGVIGLVGLTGRQSIQDVITGTDIDIDHARGVIQKELQKQLNMAVKGIVMGQILTLTGIHYTVLIGDQNIN